MSLLAIKLALARIPWQAYALLALCALLWAFGHWRYNAGQADVQARWDAAVIAQQAAQQAEAARQQLEADKAAQAATQAGKEAVATTREETGHAAETVRTIVRERIVHVDAVCRAAVALPDSVQAQGREAVARARSAMPAAPDGGNP